MNHITKLLSVAAVFGGLATGVHAGEIARWTFNTGDNTDLAADVGAFTFAEGGAGANQTTTFNSDGTVSLGTGRLLHADGLNSTDVSGITDGSTIWMRVRYDALPTDTVFWAGFVDATAPADWNQQGMVARASQTQLGSYGHTTTPADIGSHSAFTSPAAGDFFTYALVWDPGATSTQLRMYLILDGQPTQAVSASALGTTMQAVQTLGLGRLKGSGGAPAMTFDEVRVYDTVLSQSEIESIDVVPVPEPGSFCLISIAAAGLLLRGRKTSR